MKYFSRLQCWKASNITFKQFPLSARSYKHWCFVMRLPNGKVVFNDYRYSVTTSKHQSKVRGLLNQLGIQIDCFVNIRSSLDEYSGKSALRAAYWDLNTERAKTIKKTFRVKLSQEEIQDIYNQIEEAECDAYLERALKYATKADAAEYAARVQRLTDYLENDVAFWDYDIVSREKFGDADEPLAAKIAVHQVVDSNSMEKDVEDALHAFSRDGFGSVVFYV